MAVRPKISGEAHIMISQQQLASRHRTHTREDEARAGILYERSRKKGFGAVLHLNGQPEPH